jgi:hypothetical protein
MYLYDKSQAYLTATPDENFAWEAKHSLKLFSLPDHLIEIGLFLLKTLPDNQKRTVNPMLSYRSSCQLEEKGSNAK